MGMPAPVLVGSVFRPEPPLRVVKAMVLAQERATPSLPRKVVLLAAALALGVGLLLVVAALGKQEGTDPDQGWFWTPEWLAGEVEADQNIAAGRVTHHDSDEAFLASLEARRAPD